LAFKTNYAHELFNDCLYFRNQAKSNFVSAEKNKRVFETRRAIRASFISLWNFWEYWINGEILSLSQSRIMKIKGVDRLDDDGEPSVHLDRLLRQSFDVKLDLFVLLSGIDVRREAAIMKKIEEMKSTRNKLVHPSRSKPFMFEDKYVEKIDEGIETTRQFFGLLIREGRYLETTFSYLHDNAPKDLVSVGYGHIQFESQSK
jgi:hypothetical protein